MKTLNKKVCFCVCEDLGVSREELLEDLMCGGTDVAPESQQR